MNNIIKRIISVSNELTLSHQSAGSTGERIAAAFIINNMKLLPPDYQDDITGA